MSTRRPKTVRMGPQPSVSKTKYMVAFGILAAALLVAMILTSVISVPKDVVEEPKGEGCSSDDDCGPGRICAHKGCIILISSEVAEVWHQQLSAQINVKEAWKPDETFGEKVIAPKNCPAMKGKVGRPQMRKTTPVVGVSIYELVPGRVRIYKHMRVKGDVWIDSLRFWLPGFVKIDPLSVCASAEVDRISIGSATFKGMKSSYIDTSLVKAAPAGAVAAAAVSATRKQKQLKPDGAYSWKLNLDAVAVKNARYHSVVAIPLGADVTAIKGPPPTQQRLFLGFVAYYWEHDKSTSSVEITYRFPPELEVKYKLDVSELNP